MQASSFMSQVAFVGLIIFPLPTQLILLACATYVTTPIFTFDLLIVVGSYVAKN
jgi:hypothetical protein